MYDGVFRTSYFRVKNKSKFLQWLNKFRGAEIRIQAANDGYIALLRDDKIPAEVEDEDGEVDYLVFEEEIVQFLEPGQAVILQESGYEGDIEYIEGAGIVVFSDGHKEYMSVPKWAVNVIKSRPGKWSYSKPEN